MSTRYQHVRFHKLNIGEDFFFRRFRYTKTAYTLGRTVLDGRAAVVMPWTKVRSTRPFGKLASVSVHLCKSSVARPSVFEDSLGEHVRPPVPVTPGGDRRSETIGGNELTPSA